MDKDTRNDIREATEAARKLLTEDFAEQLLADFNVHSDGRIDAKPRSPELTGQHAKIIAAIQHKRAAGFSAADAVADYLRDAAFTTLNRFVALKMLEARELVQQCVTKGEESSGYGEFCGLMPGLRLLPNRAGYRLYIESLFDELSTEIKVLFDRRDPAAVLWPRRPAFDQLLILLNDAKLAGVWGEDETIGWAYQYFNSKEERAAMRDGKKTGSPAPRNSRELAVRNQFFTPRYVVQFLTDNTLGRIWYEMRDTETCLTERCEYLVRKPGEVFAARSKKDPRDIRVLDPACGSGHFLLYAFDLLLSIYEEAHADPESPVSEATGQTLAVDYPTIGNMRSAMPALILAYNLHGVDIDPRCAQIAQLALWMRAQKAYRNLGIGRADRLQIRRTNIVVAEPLVADEQIADEFVAKLGDAELGRAFSGLAESLSLAGDMGLLLRVEPLLATTPKRGETGGLFAPKDDRIRAALAQFVSEHPGRNATRTRLFAADTVHGLELTELATRRYDAIVMNPPFGEISQKAESLLDSAYDKAKGNLYIAFLYRMVELLAPGGMSGAITDATLIHQTRYEELRSDLLNPEALSIQILVANGWEVLDAYVETACLVLSKRSSAELVALDIREAGDERADVLGRLIRGISAGRLDEQVRITSRTAFEKLPKKVLTFWLPAEFLALYGNQPSLAPTFVDARCGMSSSDNPRFYKLRWEVPQATIGGGRKWRFLANGGSPSPVLRHQAYVVNWGANGQEVKARVAALYGSASRTIINESYYFRGGLTYGKRTESFSAQFLPAEQVFSNEGQAIFPNSRDDEYGLLAYLNASCIAYLLNAIAGQHKEAGYVGSIPAPPHRFLRSPEVARRIQRAHEILVMAAANVPESQEFVWPFGSLNAPQKSASALLEWVKSSSDEFEQSFLENDADLELEIGFIDGAQHPWRRRSWRLAPVVYGCDEVELPSAIAADVVSYMLGVAFGRWHLSFPMSATSNDPQAQLSEAAPAQLFQAAPHSERIFVNDVGHPDDIVAALESVQMRLMELGVGADELTRACKALDPQRSEVRSVIGAKLFSCHLDRYTRSRRKAPIYWQLSTPSASYSVWLYIHAFNRDTLFRVQEDYAATKLRHEERKLESLRQEHGTNAGPTERRAIADQEAFVDELRGFLEEVRRITPLWNPNLDDGVLLNFAPLWRLVPQNRAWQKELKAAWDGLCNEEYDWAHLAMHLWPERVVPKCATDRSLAIAHGLEAVFWVQGTDGKWTARDTPTRSVTELVQERTSPAVKAALNSLLEAPVAAGGRAKRGRAAKTITVDML